MRTRIRWRRGAGVLIVVLVAGGAVATGAAWAATLGGLRTAGLAAFDVTGGAGAPAIVACDNFTGTTGASINGRAVAVAAPCSSRTWTSHVGTWTVQANQAASSATAAAVATMSTAVVGASVQAVVGALNTGGRTGGVVLDHNGTSTYLAAVMVDGAPDRVDLRLVTAGASTVLSTVNPTFATTNTLRLTRAARAITVRLNGTVVLSFTLTAAQDAALGTGGRTGLFGGSSSVRFDDVVVTVP